MTNPIDPSLALDSPFERQRDNLSCQYTLKWRQEQLLVSALQQVKQPYLPPLEGEQRLVECLRHSRVRMVRIDPRIGETQLKFWADACEQAGKAIFLKVPTNHKFLKKNAGANWWLKRLIEWVIAALLLVVLSPLILGLALLIYFQSSEPIVTQQWCIGKRGKLFRTFKFRTTLETEKLDPQRMSHCIKRNLHRQGASDLTPLGYWMRKYRLHKLPQLFNVLRGEMSLVGPHPWMLYHAVQVSPDGLHQMNALPGITGVWRMDAKAKFLELDAIIHCDLEYLSSWSLRQDLKILLLSVPRILSGCGAYS